jgi:hypothetical protein
VLDTHARCSLPGGRPCVELARFLVSNFHCRGEVSDLVSVMPVTFALTPGRAWCAPRRARDIASPWGPTRGHFGLSEMRRGNRAPTDPDYYSPYEVSYRFHGSLSFSANSERDEFFLRRQIASVLPPHSTTTGFVYGVLDAGIKYAHIVIAGKGHPNGVPHLKPGEGGGKVCIGSGIPHPSQHRRGRSSFVWSGGPPRLARNAGNQRNLTVFPASDILRWQGRCSWNG